MTDYVMFGHSPLFGDIVDMIRANGGRLKKVVENIPEKVRAGTKPLARLIAEQGRRWGENENERPIEVQPLDGFEPEKDEEYLIGFRGHRLIPLRAELCGRFGLRFSPLIHPSAVISPTAQVGEGAFVCASAIVASGTVVGRFALLNRACTIGHDCVLEDFANVAPAANLASFVTLRRGAAIGIGATLINWVEVGCHAVVAAGAVVIENVPAQTLVAGIPAKPIKPVNLDRGPDTLD